MEKKYSFSPFYFAINDVIYYMFSYSSIPSGGVSLEVVVYPF